MVLYYRLWQRNQGKKRNFVTHFKVISFVIKFSVKCKRIGRDVLCRELQTERRMRFRLVCLFVPDCISLVAQAELRRFACIYLQAV